MQAAATIEHLTVTFADGFTALDDVSVTLPEGKIIGFIGPSGAGKTTLIRTLVGRQGWNKGKVSVLGLPAGFAQLRSRLSYMTQEVSVYPDLTVRQNLHYFATMLGLKRLDANRTIQEILETIDMTPQANQVVTSLSGGQKQRVSLAIALLSKPELMVLDEPTIGLDPVLRDKIWQLFHEIARGGVTIIISSHAMDEAARCDDLVLMRSGKLLAHDSPDALCRKTGAKTVEQSFLRLVEATS